MITRTKQNWTTGNMVKVGFLSLMVVQSIPTPGDFLPDAYILVNAAETQLYKFVPHNGLEKIDADEANALIAESRAIAASRAADAIAKASRPSVLSSLAA